MQLAFWFDQGACVGCYSCVVSCKVARGVPPGPTRWRTVVTFRGGTFPDATLDFLSNSCYHCSHPKCVAACPAGAIAKRAVDGVVVVDREACLGADDCDLCLQSCPFRAPQFGPEPNAKMQMCDFCVDRIVDGRSPVCVESCPTQALGSGPLDSARYRSVGHAEVKGLEWAEKLEPSMIFVQRRANES